MTTERKAREILAEVERGPISDYGTVHRRVAHEAIARALQAQQPEAQGGGDWPEDAALENGGYVNTCCHCGGTFTGHKRRVTCKKCSVLTPSTQPKGEVVTDEMVDRAIEGYWKSATSDGARPGISTAWMRDALTAALADKEKGNG